LQLEKVGIIADWRKAYAPLSAEVKFVSQPSSIPLINGVSTLPGHQERKIAPFQGTDNQGGFQLVSFLSFSYSSSSFSFFCFWAEGECESGGSRSGGSKVSN
jgi:hypothetical protein